MKIALITDQHFGSRGDNISINKYMVKFHEEVFFPYLEENNIDTIIHLGDIVDRRKFINFHTLNTLRTKFLNVLEQKSITMHILVGNHDTFYKNTNEINSQSELLNQYGNIHSYENAQNITIDDLNIASVPWITPENFDITTEFVKKTQAQILMGHLEIIGFEMMPGVLSHTGFAKEYFSKFDMFLSGHFHRRSNDRNIFYLGAPYEMTFADYGETRGFHIFDTTTRELDFIENPHKIFHKIYYNDEIQKYDEFDAEPYRNCYVKIIVAKKTNPYHFDKVLDKLYDVELADLSIVEDFNEYEFDEDEKIDMAQSTVQLLSDYVDGLQIPETIDSNRIKTILNQFYVEALEIE